MELNSPDSGCIIFPQVIGFTYLRIFEFGSWLSILGIILCSDRTCWEDP